MIQVLVAAVGVLAAITSGLGLLFRRERGRSRRYRADLAVRDETLARVSAQVDRMDQYHQKADERRKEAEGAKNEGEQMADSELAADANQLFG